MNLILTSFEEVSKHYQKTVQLFVTEKCNLHCGFCFRKNKGYSIEDMPLETAKKIISKYSGTDAKISFTGGEPTLNPDLEQMLQYCSELKIDSEIYTNGTSHFNNYSTQVKLRYDGFDKGHKPMDSKAYHGKYELGLLVNGTNTPQLLKCIQSTKEDGNFSGIIQITEVVGSSHLPVCGIEAYVKDAESIFNHTSEKYDWIKQIEISVGAIGLDTGAQKCRFERYFGNKLAGTCPHNKTASECKGCYFQKKVYKRRGNTIQNARNRSKGKSKNP